MALDYISIKCRAFHVVSLDRELINSSRDICIQKDFVINIIFAIIIYCIYTLYSNLFCKGKCIGRQTVPLVQILYIRIIFSTFIF